MINLKHRQYRYFGVEKKSPVAAPVIEVFPMSAVLFTGTATRSTAWGIGEDAQMFAHEAGHSMEFVRKGQFDRLHINDYGWGLPKPAGWTIKMAENECRVFAQQYLLEDLFGYPKDSLLSIGSASLFLKVASGCKKPNDYFVDTIHTAMEEMRHDFADVFKQLIEYMVEHVDTAAVAA